MTAQELAAKLNGRELGSEITAIEAREAKADDLVVVFGASDDLMEFRGAIRDEFGCYNGGTAWIHRGGILDENHPDGECDCKFCGYEAAKSRCSYVTAHWDKGDYNWMYETNIPHAVFEIREGGDKYCLGIAFRLCDLPK